MIDAFTSKYNTCFLAKILKDDLVLAADVMCDFITSLTFASEDIEKEKGVVLQEIKRD